VGFTNKGYGEFTVESMEASFRYPQDYSFFLQNVSWIHYVPKYLNDQRR
jgi:translocon-associated protein subunit alpha